VTNGTGRRSNELRMEHAENTTPKARIPEQRHTKRNMEATVRECNKKTWEK